MALANQGEPAGDQIKVTTRRSISLKPKNLMGERSNLGVAGKGGPQFGKRKDGLTGSPGKLSQRASSLSEGVSKLRGKGALA